MQIMQFMMSRVFIYPIICHIHLKDNFVLFINMYGFIKFLCNVFA